MHHHIGDTFDVPLAALGLNPARNYRRATAEDPTLAELAQSMRELGQLQPILVAYDGAGTLGLVAGFRRATAAQAIGWTTVRATLIDGANADLARLAENFDRTNPTTYETSRYLYELATGAHGRRRTYGELAQALGLSASHVRNLVRVYRDAPQVVREAWKADRDRRFTFARLNELVLKVKRGEDLSGALGGVLTQFEETARAAPHSGAAREKAPKSGMRRLGPSKAERMARELAAAGEERLGTDDRALLLLEVLSAVAGRLPVAQVQARVDGVLADLGVSVTRKNGRVAR